MFIDLPDSTLKHPNSNFGPYPDAISSGMLQNGLQGRTLQGVGVGQLDGGGILRLTLTESFPCVVSLVASVATDLKMH